MTAIDPLIGQVLAGRFTILELIDRGGMARVYRAEQASLGRPVAVKILDPALAGDNRIDEFEQRFFLEASACSKLTHPNTVTIFDYGATPEGVFYIAMELLEGKSLAQVIKTEAPLPLLRAIHIVRQVARSLREAHRRGIVHRDLKPANVFLIRHDDDRDFVKVLDFGLVKEMRPRRGADVTEAGLFLGTPRYTAPEQINGDDVDPRCDVYALGIILHEMLTGKQLFPGDNTMSILMAKMKAPAPAVREINPTADVPDEVERIVSRCLAIKPADRFASMDELLVAIRMLTRSDGPLSMLGSDPSTSGPLPNRFATSTPPPLHRPPFVPISGAHSVPGARLEQPGGRRRSGVLAGVGLLAAVIIGGGVWLGLRSLQAPAAIPAPAAAKAPASGDSSPSVAGAAGSRTTSPADQHGRQPSRGRRSRPAAARPDPRARVELRSTPKGATVFIGNDMVCRATPCDLVWTGDAARRGREVEFRFTLEGAQDAIVSSRLEGNELAIAAVLKRESPRRAGGAKRGAETSPAPATAAPPREKRKEILNHYKDNPYD